VFFFYEKKILINRTISIGLSMEMERPKYGPLDIGSGDQKERALTPMLTSTITPHI
jgi:hypothetical protein